MLKLKQHLGSNEEKKGRGRERSEQGDQGGQGEESKGLLETTDDIARTSAELIPALHLAKEELAHELEANLKQLKEVISESNRVAKALESVLEEVQATSAQEETEQTKQSPADQKKTSQGTDSGMNDQQKNGAEGKAKQSDDSAQGDDGQRNQGAGDKRDQGADGQGSGSGQKGDAPPETQRGQAAGRQKEDNPRQSEGKVPKWQPPQGGQ